MRFESLIDAYHDEIYRYVWRLVLGGGLEPQDLVQETFMRAYQAYGRLRPESNHRAWLYRIATNCVYSALRRHRIMVDVDEVALSDDLPEPEAVALQQEQMAAVQAVIETLPLRQRAALTMRYIHELSYEEIAQALDCSGESARAHVSLGLRRVRRELQARE